MKEFFDQTTKMMENAWENWQRTVGQAPWLKQPQSPPVGSWSSWFATIRSTYDLNMGAWKTMLEHSEEAFFSMLKDSPIHSESFEAQLRQIWATMKTAQEAQHQVIRDGFRQMESMLKEKQ